MNDKDFDFNKEILISKFTDNLPNYFRLISSDQSGTRSRMSENNIIIIYYIMVKLNNDFLRC